MTALRWQQIERLYHAALEYGEHQRAEFLAYECNGDADLRGEVESLLAMDLLKTGTLDRPAWEGAPEFAGTKSGALWLPYQSEDPGDDQSIERECSGRVEA